MSSLAMCSVLLSAGPRHVTPTRGVWDRALVVVMCVLATGGATRLASMMPLERPAEANLSICETKVFRPSVCRDDEVVMVTRAYYGRMETGDCVETDYGYIGCRVNVLPVLDKKCSGRRTCEVRVPNAELQEVMAMSSDEDGRTACPSEFKPYLQVSYSCVKVEMAACRKCDNLAPEAELTSPTGYLAGIVTTENKKCGTGQCPWSIKAAPGQNINVTLLDFSGKVLQYSAPDNCFRYAVIKEKSRPEPEPVCAEQGRRRHLYTSVSNAIYVQVISPQGFARRGQFLIHYQAVGCRDYTAPEYAWMKREHARLEVGCDGNSHKWVLQCVGTKWRGDTVGVCPKVGPGTQTQDATDVITLPLGVLVAIVVGIALVIGVLILTVGVVCLKRQQGSRMQATYYYRTRHDYDYPMGDLGREMYIAPKSGIAPTEPSKYQPVMVPQSGGRPPLQHAALAGAGRENWYKRMERLDLQARPLPSLPNIAEASGGSASTASRSDDDPQLTSFTAEVHRSDSDRERRYLTNPRPARSQIQSRSPSNHSSSSSVTGAQQLRNQGNNQQQPPLMSGRPAKPPTSLRDGPQYFVLDTADRAEARRTARAANAQAASEVKPQKSPEEENTENSNKEFSRNNSCHEIPLRPTRISANNVNNTSTENTTGKTSWP